MNFRLSVKQSCSARCFKSLSLVRCFVCASCPRVAVARVNYFCSTAELELPDSTNKAERCTRPSFLKSKGKVTVSVNLPESNKEKILRELNNRTFEELSNTTGIGKNKATTLMQYRENFGSMKLVDELFQVKGFGSAFLKKLEEMGELPPVKKKTPKGLETIWELLKHNDKEVIHDIVSIDIGFRNAAWIHMDVNKRVLGWSRSEILKPNPYNPAKFQPLVQEFVNKVPKTDIYVVEMQSHRIGKQNAALLPFAVHLRVFEAMLTCLLPGLAIPFDPLYTSKHFCLPNGTVKKKAAVNLVESLFLERSNEEPFETQCEQYVKQQQGMGGSEELVESFISSSPPGRLPRNFKPLLQISPKFVDYFKSCDKKDDLSDCLLQALAFYDLIVESRK